MKKPFTAFVLVFCLAVAERGEAGSTPTAAVVPSTTTARGFNVITSTVIYHPIRAIRRHLKSGAKRIHGAIKSTQPNPHIHQGQASAMPSQAPAMPPAPAVAPPTAAKPQTGSDRFFSEAAKIMTRSWGQNIFVWLPAVSTDPNAGPTYGILPVLVLADPQTHHIRHLLAPSYTYNDLFGQTLTGRYYFYPDSDSQLYATGSFSQHTNRELKLRYEDTSALDGVLYVRGEAYTNVDGSAHFYGVGPQSHEGDETGYTAEQTAFDGTVGVNFMRAFRATVNMSFLRFRTASNIIPDTTDITTRFPDTPGLGTNNTETNEFRLLWDTRDSPVTPSYGSTAEVYAQRTVAALGSDADYFRYGTEARRLFPWAGGKQTTVVHGLYDQTNGPFIPFYDLPSVGGRTTLRGFGDGRLTDRGRLALNVEQRYTFASLGLMGIQTNFELAPFVDLGTVFPTIGEMERRYFRPVYGAAFRAAVKPNVVGDVEIGIGQEGPAVFVDINYPY